MVYNNVIFSYSPANSAFFQVLTESGTARMGTTVHTIEDLETMTSEHPPKNTVCVIEFYDKNLIVKEGRKSFVAYKDQSQVFCL